MEHAYCVYLYRFNSSLIFTKGSINIVKWINDWKSTSEGREEGTSFQREDANLEKWLKYRE